MGELMDAYEKACEDLKKLRQKQELPITGINTKKPEREPGEEG